MVTPKGLGWPSYAAGLCLLAHLILLAGCGGEAPIPDEARQKALDAYKTICVTCHGAEGKGDGPGSVALNPKPRSFVDGEWQASVDDEHIKKVITLGGASVGKSPIMPAQPQFKSQPEVLRGLVAIVRGFGGK